MLTIFPRELNEFFTKKHQTLREIILQEFKKKKSGRQIAKELDYPAGSFYRLLQKLKIKNPQSKKFKINRIFLRRQGKSICEIAEIEQVSPEAIYSYLLRHSPGLLSKDFLASINPDDSLIGYRMQKTSRIFTNDDLLELLSLRKQGYSISLQVTYPQRLAEQKLWYIYIKRRNKGLLSQKNIGRAKREFIHFFYSEEVIRQKEQENNHYLSVNEILDIILLEEGSEVFSSASHLKGQVDLENLDSLPLIKGNIEEYLKKGCKKYVTD